MAFIEFDTNKTLNYFENLMSPKSPYSRKVSARKF